MESNGGKPEPADPENVVRMLELELMRQRAVRQHGTTPYRGLRAMSFVFLFVVILVTLLALYYFFFSGRLEELRAHSPQSSPSAPAVSSTP